MKVLHYTLQHIILRRGAHRGKRNKLGLTAFDEAKNDEIRIDLEKVSMSDTKRNRLSMDSFPRLKRILETDMDKETMSQYIDKLLAPVEKNRSYCFATTNVHERIRLLRKR